MVARKRERSTVAGAALAGLSLLSAPVLAQAQTTPAAVPASLSLSIPAGPLESGILNLGRQANLRMLYPSSLTTGKQTRGLSGQMTSQQAVGRLLEGTGLSYSFSAANVVRIFDPATTGPDGRVTGGEGIQLDTVQVDGSLPAPYAGGQVATGDRLGILGNRDFMDAPFNVITYTSKTIADQQARTVADVTKNDPSVRTTWADGSYSNQFVIRGFPVANTDIAINGLYGLVPYQMAGTAWVDRVEILKGPSAFVMGMPPGGSIGGTVNLTTKHAPMDDITRLTLGYISDSQFGGKIDVSRRYGDDRQFGVRVNGSYSNGDTPVSSQSNELGEAAIALDAHNDRARFSADIIYQKNSSDNPARPVYLRAGALPVPAAPPASANLGQDYYYADGKDFLGIVRAEVDVTDNITVYGTLGGRKNDFLGFYNFIYLTNPTGAFDANVYFQPSYNSTITGETGVRANFQTGALRHELVVSYSGFQSELGVIAPVVQTYKGNIYAPSVVAPPSLVGRATSAPKTSTATLSSVAIADSLYAFDDRLQLILGARYQSVDQQAWNATTGAAGAHYDDEALTPAVGIVVKPWERVSLYANYVEGLSQGPTAPAGSSNVGQIFAPIQSRQVEAGVKVDFGKVAATLSAFQISQPNGILNAATNYYDVDGEVRNRGIELNVFGALTDELRILGGVTFMDGVQTKTAGGTYNGKAAVGIPDIQLNIGAEWDLPFVKGLTLTGRYIYTSSQYASVDNLQSIPDWNRTDVGARYVFDRADGKPVTIRANVENVFNESYWAAASSSFGLARGAPRTYLISTTFDF
ncbi:TonB dependent/Ligand-Gated channel TonB [Azorhizobium oxalatiphilum]|uniref:TonB dependent/Ligand-Gated channel TonB n=1 Tax=Azorhizobium oxalatiphilum TaxID=980631 RepID=A0A917BX55_9HYPH|nr:TonB-dependent receptor [Azorhizobium oxalatiphilum]GGF58249.1 TonB dependent/Ligand-Gated channel TonB [Azorhizobium oxalatiphilum]